MGARGAIGQFKCGWSGGGSSSSALLKTFPTEDRPALRGFEGDGGLLATPGAIGPRFHLVIIAWRRGSQCGGPLGLAGFATFGFIGELLIVEEQLLSRRKHEVRSAVNTLQYLILEFHGEVLPSARDSQAHGRGQLAIARQNRTERSSRQSQIPVLRYNSLGSAHHALSAWPCKYKTAVRLSPRQLGREQSKGRHSNGGPSVN